MGTRPDTKIPEKWGRNRKWPQARNGRRMAAKMEKNGPQNEILAILGSIFPFRQPFFAHVGPGAIFLFQSHFSVILVSGQFPIL